MSEFPHNNPMFYNSVYDDSQPEERVRRGSVFSENEHNILSPCTSPRRKSSTSLYPPFHYSITTSTSEGNLTWMSRSSFEHQLHNVYHPTYYYDDIDAKRTTEQFLRAQSDSHSQNVHHSSMGFPKENAVFMDPPKAHPNLDSPHNKLGDSEEIDPSRFTNQSQDNSGSYFQNVPFSSTGFSSTEHSAFDSSSKFTSNMSTSINYERKCDETDPAPFTYQPPEKKETTHPAYAPVDKYSLQYNMSHKIRGYTVIFNNVQFDDNDLKSRSGSSVDTTKIFTAFELLGFKVVLHNNLTRNLISDKITELATETDFTDCDTFCLIVLTHGENQGFLHAKDYVYAEKELWTPFTANRCSSLAGKPKLFFIQACRGGNCEKGTLLRKCSTETDSVPNESYVIPNMVDFLIAHSTVDGYCSWRHPENGSWFIQELCNTLIEEYQTTDLLTMLTHICRKVALGYESYHPKIPERCGCKQATSFTSTLMRDIYFKTKDITNQTKTKESS